MIRFMRRKRSVHLSAKLLLIGLLSVGAVLSACTSLPQAEPKYPIYMQDRPASPAVPAPHPMGAIKPEAPVETAPVAAPVGTVTSSTLATLPPVAPAPVVKPATVSESKASYVYTVQAKDTLYGISRRFGVPVKLLSFVNGLKDGAGLSIGQKINLPEAAKDKGVEIYASGPAPAKVVTKVAPITPQPQTLPQTQPAPTVALAEPAKTPVVNPVIKPVDKPAVVKVSTFPTASTLTKLGKGQFIWPLKGPLLVPYGQLAPNIRNDGINIGASEGAEIRAAADGEVVYVGGHVKELGNTAYVQHAGGWYTGYSHMAKIDVKTNQKIQKGEVIGTVGKSGAVEKPQLHFEIRYTPSTEIAKPIDPNLVLP